MKKIIAMCLAASAAVLAVAPFAGGHSTVSLLQPQGRVLTSARAAYVLRAPTEKATQSTIQVTLHVPAPVQESISVKQLQDWKVVLKKRQTGQVDAEGNPRMAIERITWIARNKDSWAEPGMYAEFSFRMQNPASPQRLCFSIDQWYSKKTTDGKPEVVKWSGASDSATPASCIDVVSS